MNLHIYIDNKSYRSEFLVTTVERTMMVQIFLTLASLGGFAIFIYWLIAKMYCMVIDGFMTTIRFMCSLPYKLISFSLESLGKLLEGLLELVWDHKYNSFIIICIAIVIFVWYPDYDFEALKTLAWCEIMLLRLLSHKTTDVFKTCMGEFAPIIERCMLDCYSIVKKLNIELGIILTENTWFVVRFFLTNCVLWFGVFKIFRLMKNSVTAPN